MAKKMKTTYRVRYWFRGKVHYTSPSYTSRKSAQAGLDAFRRKYPSRKSNIAKQTVVPI